MFGLGKKKKRGKIEIQFAWLSAKRIAEDFAKNSGNALAAATALTRLAILGGIELKKSLEESKLLVDAAPDQIIAFGAGFSWSFIFRSCVSGRNYDLHSDEQLCRFIYIGAETLHSILESTSGLAIQKNFSSQYPSHDLLSASEKLVSQLLDLAGIGLLESALDQVGTNLQVKTFASNYLPALINASAEILKMRERS